MALNEFINQWRVRAQRRRMIRQELIAFAKISPELYSDIGLFPQDFHDKAEWLVNRNLRHCSAQIEGRSECPPGAMQTCPSGAG